MRYPACNALPRIQAEFGLPLASVPWLSQNPPIAMPVSPVCSAPPPASNPAESLPATPSSRRLICPASSAQSPDRSALPANLGRPLPLPDKPPPLARNRAAAKDDPSSPAAHYDL